MRLNISINIKNTYIFNLKFVNRINYFIKRDCVQNNILHGEHYLLVSS